MSAILSERIRLTDLAPELGDARTEFLAGLRARPKRIAPKFFYDERGSRLFDRICELDEYYPARTETLILRENLPAITAACGSSCLLVELGSGSSSKTRLLLEHLENPAAYVPIDISRRHLLDAAERLATDFADLEILPVCADYARPLLLPDPARAAQRTAVFFPGSTIGNFKPADAESFLRRVARWCQPRDRLIIGVDLVKEPAVLHAAYNDHAGVTAEFNLNLLHRANREFDGRFDPERFAHEAIYDVERGRVEMRLVSRCAQQVEVAGKRIRFHAGERVLTEYSCKYTLPGFAALARKAGWEPLECWTDDQNWFAVFAFQLGDDSPG